MAASYGGYDYSFVDEDSSDKFTCNICTKVLRDPYQTGCCGQNYCESCLNNWFSKNYKQNCPHCRAEGKEFQYFLDKKLKREIDSLGVLCTNKAEGCDWSGELGSLKHHLESAKGCDFVVVECPNGCTNQALEALTYRFKGRIKRRHLKHHLENECPIRPHQCEYCGREDTYMNIASQSHYDECPEVPLQCPNMCMVQPIKRKNMIRHRGKCPKEPVRCPFEEAGCKEKLVRCELEEHMSATQQQHLLLVMGAYKKLKIESEEMKRNYEELKRENKEMKRDNYEMKVSCAKSESELTKVKGELSQTKAELHQIKEKQLPTRSTVFMPGNPSNIGLLPSPMYQSSMMPQANIAPQYRPVVPIINPARAYSSYGAGPVPFQGPGANMPINLGSNYPARSTSAEHYY